MTTIYDVPADSLINEVAKDLKENKRSKRQVGQFVKTGVHKKEGQKTLTGGMCDVHPSSEESILTVPLE